MSAKKGGGTDVNPHTCPHSQWVDDTNLPGDDEERCIACGTVHTYIGKYYAPCCGYGSDYDYQGRPAPVCKWA